MHYIAIGSLHAEEVTVALIAGLSVVALAIVALLQGHNVRAGISTSTRH